MKISKTLIPVLIVFLPLIVGCASGGTRKPTVFVDKPNNIPADIPSQFDSRYEFFITGKEMVAFHKLQTDEERQVFQDKFWLERDPDPATPENEEKERIDRLIDNIANEPFLSEPGVFGLSFRENGRFRGDMAHVYLLYGEPDAMDTIEGNLFVPLMLWIYFNEQNSAVLYAFLFYQKSGLGAFSLFSQDVYKLDSCGAINEIKRFRSVNAGGVDQICPPEVEKVFRELQDASGRGGVLGGDIFSWALFNFSQDSSITQGKALGVPKPASEIAKQSKARVIGEAPGLTGTAGTDYILASCEKCGSFMPGELYMGQRFTISGPWKNFDWTVKGEYLNISLKFRIILEHLDSIEKPIIIEGNTEQGINKKFAEDNQETVVTVDLIDPTLVASIPAGTYRTSVYVQNMMTKKYNAWNKEFTK